GRSMAVGAWGAAFAACAAGLTPAGMAGMSVPGRRAGQDGPSPGKTREVPPLDYARVYRLKAANPDLDILVNGGIADIGEASRHLKHVDGVMMGRAAYREPWRLLAVDPEIFGEQAPPVSPRDALEQPVPHLARAP